MESKLAEKMSNLMEKYSKSFGFAFLPHYSGVSLRIRKFGESGDIQKVKNVFYVRGYSY